MEMEPVEKVILEFSAEAQTLIEDQDIDIYQELQQEIPSLQLTVEHDPDAASGTRDATTVILAVATLVSSLTPIILRIFNQFTPPNRAESWEVEETETRQPDGTTTIHRKRIRSTQESRLPESSHQTTETKQVLPRQDTKAKE